jgi:hypothetical protein
MIKNKRLILVLGIITFIVSGCGKQAPTAMPNSVSAIQTPEPGTAVVTGKIISTILDKPLGTAVWLAEVHGEGDQGVYFLNATSSPGIYADDNGLFVLKNIKPQKYVIIVGEPEGQNEVITDDSNKPKVWDILADQIYEVGELRVKLTK